MNTVIERPTVASECKPCPNSGMLPSDYSQPPITRDLATRLSTGYLSGLVRGIRLWRSSLWGPTIAFAIYSIATKPPLPAYQIWLIAAGMFALSGIGTNAWAKLARTTPSLNDRAKWNASSNRSVSIG